MEQKMLLPIVIVVLVGGFLIGYYAATGIGTAAKQGKGAVPITETQAVSKAQYAEFFQAHTYTQFLKGAFEGSTDDTVSISNSGKTLVIKKPRVTNFFISTANGRTSVEPQLLKQGEQVDVMAVFDAETGKPVNLAVTANR